MVASSSDLEYDTIIIQRKRSLSIEAEALRDGKEDSYERNPGRVSFVFNQKFFCTF